MASKLTCPECSTVLRPTRPVAPGKKVKCPRCDTVFTAPEEDDEVVDVVDVEDDDERPAKKRRPAPAAAAKKKPAAKAAPAAPAKKKAGNDDDDDNETYGYMKEDVEAEEKKKPKINYAPDMSIKDLRGPAQAMVMSPSNYLTLVGFIGFFAYMAILILLMIPALFPIKPDADKPRPVQRINPGLGAMSASGGGGGGFGNFPPPAPTQQKPKIEEEKPSFYEVGGYDISVICDFAWYWFLICLIPLIVLMLYSGMVAFGAIKMQNLESRGWGIAASIMAMLPLNVAGLQLLLAILLQLILTNIMDDESFIQLVCMVIAGIAWALSAGVGVWALKTLMDEDVIAGYEYIAE